MESSKVIKHSVENIYQLLEYQLYIVRSRQGWISSELETFRFHQEQQKVKLFGRDWCYAIQYEDTALRNVSVSVHHIATPLMTPIQERDLGGLALSTVPVTLLQFCSRIIHIINIVVSRFVSFRSISFHEVKKMNGTCLLSVGFYLIETWKSSSSFTKPFSIQWAFIITHNITLRRCQMFQVSLLDRSEKSIFVPSALTNFVSFKQKTINSWPLFSFSLSFFRNTML